MADLSPGEVGGIVAGCCFVLLLIGVLLFCFMRRDGRSGAGANGGENDPLLAGQGNRPTDPATGAHQRRGGDDAGCYLEPEARERVNLWLDDVVSYMRRSALVVIPDSGIEIDVTGPGSSFLSPSDQLEVASLGMATPRPTTPRVSEIGDDSVGVTS